MVRRVEKSFQSIFVEQQQAYTSCKSIGWIAEMKREGKMVREIAETSVSRKVGGRVLLRDARSFSKVLFLIPITVIQGEQVAINFS